MTPLARQIVRIVTFAPGGGLHREQVAAAVGLPAYGPELKQALMAAWSRGRIDFVRQYVVAPGEQGPAGESGGAVF